VTNVPPSVEPRLLGVATEALGTAAVVLAVGVPLLDGATIESGDGLDAIVRDLAGSGLLSAVALPGNLAVLVAA
jgi:hypothetical protein